MARKRKSETSAVSDAAVPPAPAVSDAAVPPAQGSSASSAEVDGVVDRSEKSKQRTKTLNAVLGRLKG